MVLDTETANELLKSLPPEEVQEIAVEMAHIDANGQLDRKEHTRIIREFHEALQGSDNRLFSIKGFLNDMLINVVGKDKAEEIQYQVQAATQKRDPFIPVKTASTDELVLALEGEHAQTIAVVLSELPPEKSQQVLSNLSEAAQSKAVKKMMNLEQVRSEVKQRIAAMMRERLKNFKGETLPEKREQTLRKLAVMLGGLQTSLSDRLLEEIRKYDEQTSQLVRNFMIVWDDIPDIADRSLQEILREVDTAKLAVALYGADEDIAEKIKSNISERAAEMLSEEMSLMQEPLEKEITEAREEVVGPLRKANEEGTLRINR
jgi:flagellar motor switch protein FliG